jgi:hypothetical protein
MGFRNIGIRFKRAEYLRWISAVKSVEKQAKYEARNVPRKHALKYMQMVQSNILNQKYTFPALSDEYAAWKAKYGYPPGFWQLHGNILKYLNLFKVSHSNIGGKRVYAWMGGVPNGIKVTSISWFEKGKDRIRDVAWYGKRVEEGFTMRGGKVVKPRPMFGNTARDFQQEGHISKRLDVSKTYIKLRWK